MEKFKVNDEDMTVAHLPTSQVLPFLHSRSTGLTTTEAATRAKLSGPNELPKQAETALTIFIRQLKNPLLFILAFAAIASYSLGQHSSAITILAMILTSIVLGFYNEYRSEKIIQDLHTHIQPKTTVIRAGETIDIPTSAVTLGDLVPLLPGTIAPADLRLIDAEGLEVDESVLSGESVPVTKDATGISTMRHRSAIFANCVYFGTNVAAGHGVGVVFRIGQKTAFGQITGSVARLRPETSFQFGVRSFGYLLVRTVFLIAAAIFIGNLILHRPFVEAILFTLAIAIGLTPELLPAIISVSMSRGAHNLAKKKVVVKQIVAIEDLGNMDVLCTDKTGTLTEGILSLTNYYAADAKPNSRLLHLAGWSCLQARSHHRLTSPFDKAISNFIKNNQIHLPSVTFISQSPFDFVRRRMSTVVQEGDDKLMITKGAVESVLQVCSHVRHGSKLVAMSKYKAVLLQDFQQKSTQGQRLLAIATKEISSSKIDPGREKAMVFEGFLAYEDKEKRSAKTAMARLKDLGVRVVLISGDHPLVCQKVYADLGFPIRRTVTGDEIEKMSDHQLTKIIGEVDVFAETTPEQKLRLIHALKANHQTVGYVGDGINDVPSLHQADVGISVPHAVDVAKDAASIVLLRQDLATIADGIEEGRRIFSNTIKYILMGTSSNFGNMISAAVGSFILPFLPMLPTQILLTNVMYDLSQLAIPTDQVDSEDLRKPSHWNINFIQKFMLFFGPISSLYDFFTFGVLYLLMHASASVFQTGWYIESLMTQTLVIFVIRTHRFPFFKSRASTALLASSLFIVGVGVTLTLLPLDQAFGFSILPARFYLILAAMVLSYLVLVDIAKKKFYRTYSPS